MSVLIKGMKMPEKCGSCDLFHVESPMHCTVVKGHKTVGAPYGMPRPDWCPLVEIPEPHGDLIDRDALIAQLESDAEQMEEPIAKMFTYAAINDLKHAQIILEAEGSETHADD